LLFDEFLQNEDDQNHELPMPGVLRAYWNLSLAKNQIPFFEWLLLITDG
jgi:hypothetical protein